MDHAINSVRVFYDIAYEELFDEWKSGQYKKLSDCPSFRETEAYRQAMNVMVKACYLPEYVKSHLVRPLSKQIKEQLEIEQFWAERDDLK